jgi:uncharacterized membrane protein YcjF (UPF0283 family)
MARHRDGFEDRLERLELEEEHRAEFDSKVRSLKTDSSSTITPGEPETDEHMVRLVSLMEDLAKRLDVHDRKYRTLAEVSRRRESRDRRWRRSIAAAAAVLVCLAIGGWARARFDTPTTTTRALE